MIEDELRSIRSVSHIEGQMREIGLIAGLFCPFLSLSTQEGCYRLSAHWQRWQGMMTP